MYFKKINSIPFKKLPAWLYRSLILGGFGLFMNLAFESAIIDSLAAADTTHNHPEEIKGVGPGVSPHYHNSSIENLHRVTDIAKNPADVPPAFERQHSEKIAYHLSTQEVVSTLSDGVDYVFWTFNQTVPGPMLRARVGDTVELAISNHPTSTHDHSIDLHAVTGPGGGGLLTQVKPGEEKTISFKPMHAGVYLYHCASPNIPSHITNGLYGLMVVDPPQGMPPVDREFYVVQGELYTQGGVGVKGFQEFAPAKMLDEKPEYIVFNGRVKALTGDKSLKANQGETIRIFLGNGGVAKISNFHIIGEIFDKVYPEGTLGHFHPSVQTTMIPAGGASITELKLKNAGNYILVDHALSRLDRGAYGMLEVRGSPVPDLLQQIQRETK